jgi:N-acetylmuramoyl-L-alanine amidase
MKTIYIFFSILFIFSICNAQTETTVSITFNNKTISLPAVTISGIRYASGSSVGDQFKINKFFNPSNSKLELKFDKYLLKFTGSNSFVTITSKETADIKVVQIPVNAIRFKNDIYIPFDFCKNILELALQGKLDIKNSAALSNEKKQPEPENNKTNISDAAPVKPKPEKNQKISEDNNLTGKYDIYGIEIDGKANGTLVKFRCSKKLNNYSTNIDKGILLLNIVGVTADNNITKDLQPKGLVKKIKFRKLGSNLQFEIYLNEGYSSSEAFQDPGSNEFLITIHNKLLSNSSSYNKQKERWIFDTIVIDAGHGGKDPGAIGVTGVKEKDINLAIALKLGQYIKDEMKDIKVVYTRSTDKFIELYKRGKIANENNGKLFISLHCNSMPKKPSNRNGFEIYLLRPGRTAEAIAIAESENSVISYEDNPEKYQALTDENFILVSMAHSSYMKYSEQFSDILNKQFSNDLSVVSNGVKQAGFYVLVGASMPSVLVETGFISNKKDEAYLDSKSGQNEIAHSIFNSIKSFKEQYDHNLKAEL